MKTLTWVLFAATAAQVLHLLYPHEQDIALSGQPEDVFLMATFFLWVLLLVRSKIDEVG